MTLDEIIQEAERLGAVEIEGIPHAALRLAVRGDRAAGGGTMKETDCSHYEEADGDCLLNACSGCCIKYRAELDALRLALATATKERDEARAERDRAAEIAVREALKTNAAMAERDAAVARLALADEVAATLRRAAEILSWIKFDDGTPNEWPEQAVIAACIGRAERDLTAFLAPQKGAPDV